MIPGPWREHKAYSDTEGGRYGGFPPQKQKDGIPWYVIAVFIFMLLSTCRGS